MNSFSENTLSICLTPDEAIVLFEFVRRFSNTDILSIEDQAEERALWNLCCIFEKSLALQMEGSYADTLSIARDRLRDE